MFNFWIVFLEWLKLFGEFILFWGISLSLSVYIKLIYKQLLSAANMAMKRKEMTTEQKEIVIRLVNKGRFQRKIANTVARTNIRTPPAELTGIVNQTLPHKISSRSVSHRFKLNRYTRRKVRKTLTINTTERKRCISSDHCNLDLWHSESKINMGLNVLIKGN